MSNTHMAIVDTATLKIFEAPGETLPRHSYGIDWGAVRKVVARVEGPASGLLGPLQVIWVPGSTGFHSRGVTAYFGGHLKALGRPNRKGVFTDLGVDIARDGRLAAHLKDPAVRAKIAEHLGIDVALLPSLKQRQTYVVHHLPGTP